MERNIVLQPSILTYIPKMMNFGTMYVSPALNMASFWVYMLNFDGVCKRVGLDSNGFVGV